MALMLALVFSVWLDWLPGFAGFRGEVGNTDNVFERVLDVRHLRCPP